MQVLSNSEIGQISGGTTSQAVVHPITFPVMNPNPPYIGGPIHTPPLA